MYQNLSQHLLLLLLLHLQSSHLAEARWHFISTITAVTVITSIARQPLLYVPTCYFCYCFSETNIQEILWIRTKNSEWLKQSNTTPADIIIKLFIWVTFQDKKKWKTLADKTTHMGMRFHSILVQSNCQKGFKWLNSTKYWLRLQLVTSWVTNSRSWQYQIT